MLTYLLLCQLIGERCEIVARLPSMAECVQAVRSDDMAATMGVPVTRNTSNGTRGKLVCVEIPASPSRLAK